MAKKKKNSKDKPPKAKAGKSAESKPSAKAAKKGDKKRSSAKPAPDAAPQEFEYVEVNVASVFATPMWQGQFIMTNGDLLTATVVGISVQQGVTLFNLVVLGAFGGTTQRSIPVGDIEKAYVRLPRR